MFKFTKDYINSLQTIEDYNIFFKKIVEKEITEAPYSDDGFYAYTEANFKRINSLKTKIDLDKKLYNALQEVSNWHFVLITEPWCGDASFAQPVIEAVTVAGDLNLKIAIRDKNENLINAFLTNGGKSIPIFIALDENLNYKFHWGPRPKPLQEEVVEFLKTKPSVEEKIKMAHLWYLKDKGKTFQQELLDLIKQHK
ncbi:MAG: thioredoxin family protein [Chitinophagales bacterium]|nr:thioredoxin family protein [Bacteroidota bacterium]MCB9226880.1 thioredoxin family protein [Chitinophagales bacterium]